jgi:hypothetical protein
VPQKPSLSKSKKSTSRTAASKVSDSQKWREKYNKNDLYKLEMAFKTDVA